MPDDKYIPVFTSLVSCVGTFIGSILTCGTAILVAWWINRNLKKHETVFGHLHKKKAEAIELLFKKLVVVNEMLGRLTNIHLAGSQGEQNKRFTEARATCEDFFLTFDQNCIYLDKSFCAFIRGEFFRAMSGFLAKVDLYIIDTQMSSQVEFATIKQLSIDFQSKIAPAHEELEKEFRKMLGND